MDDNGVRSIGLELRMSECGIYGGDKELVAAEAARLRIAATTLRPMRSNAMCSLTTQLLLLALATAALRFMPAPPACVQARRQLTPAVIRNNTTEVNASSAQGRLLAASLCEQQHTACTVPQLGVRLMLFEPPFADLVRTHALLWSEDAMKAASFCPFRFCVVPWVSHTIARNHLA